MTILHALETTADVATWQASPREEGPVVALSVDAVIGLDSAGVQHSTIEDHYSEAALIARARDGNEQVAALCALLDDVVGASFDSGLPAFSARYYAGRLRVLRDNFLRAAFVLDALLSTFSPDRVVLAAATAPSPVEIWVESPRFLSWVLAELCHQRGIACTFLPVAAQLPTTPPFPLERFKGWARRWRDSLRSWFPGRGDLAYHYWPSQPVATLAQAYIATVALPAAPPASSKACPPMELSACGPFFRFGDVDLASLARPHLATLLGDFRMRHLAAVARASAVLRRARAKGAVATAPLTVESVSALLAARMAAKPAIVLQHGGFNGYCDWAMLPLTDLNLSNHYLVYGPRVAQALEGDAISPTPQRPQPVTMHPTGSSNVASIRAARGRCTRSTGGACRVLYVTTYITGSTRYLAGHHRPDISYWRTQRAVIAALGERQDWQAVFRPPPHRAGDSALETLVDDARRAGVAVRADGLLSDLLREEWFDLIITDAVTTVLLEVLATDAPVITWFDPQVMRLRPEAADLLAKRVRLAFSAEEFLNQIAEAMDAPSARLPIDDSFLLGYALAGEDDPAKLQATSLADILRGGEY